MIEFADILKQTERSGVAVKKAMMTEKPDSQTIVESISPKSKTFLNDSSQMDTEQKQKLTKKEKVKRPNYRLRLL